MNNSFVRINGESYLGKKFLHEDKFFEPVTRLEQFESFFFSSIDVNDEFALGKTNW